MSSFATALTQSVRYRGREGQLLFLGHRLSGLGTLLFLSIHILDTSTVYFFPNLYEHAIGIYRSTPIMVTEMLLVAAVMYHGVNGLKIIANDLFPHLWEKTTERQAFWRIAIITTILTAPAVFFMGRSLYLNNLCRCPSETDVSAMSAMAPWAMLGAAALAVVGLFAGVPLANGRVTAGGAAPARRVEVPRKSLEAWSWQFMRWSGALLIPLVWFHVLLQDVLVGVHAIDLSYSQARLAMTGWKVYDIFLLAFTFGHGMNGLRSIVEEYVLSSAWKRTLKWTMLAGYLVITTIGAITIIFVTGT